MWNLVLNLRYFARSEELNGRQVQWYNAIIVIMGGPLIGPLMIQQNINEYNTRSAA